MSSFKLQNIGLWLLSCFAGHNTVCWGKNHNNMRNNKPSSKMGRAYLHYIILICIENILLFWTWYRLFCRSLAIICNRTIICIRHSNNTLLYINNMEEYIKDIFDRQTRRLMSYKYSPYVCFKNRVHKVLYKFYRFIPLYTTKIMAVLSARD